MINYTEHKLRIFPYNGDVAPSEIDRVQSIEPRATLNKERKNELGREGAVGYKKGIPEIAYSATQLEYGNMEFWRKLTNKADSVTALTLNDFKTSQFDVIGQLTDDDGTFKGTIHYPKMRVNGFNFSIGDPEADAERSFDLIGEKAIQWQEDNKYFIYARHEAGSGADNVIDLSAKAPALLPDENVSGNSDAEKYIYRVLRVRGTTTTELTVDTDYSYSDATKELTIVSIQTLDVIKVYYTSATAPDTLFANNDADPASISADSVIIEIGAGEHLYRLQSIDLGVTFDRIDQGEIGNPEKVLRGITDKTVSITLGRLLEDFTIEEALRGEGTGYGQIDFSKFSDDITITVKVYEDSTHETFKIGFKATALSVSEVSSPASVGEYDSREVVLEGENLTITDDINEL